MNPIIEGPGTIFDGNTFPIEGEMGEMTSSFVYEVLLCAVSISPDTLDIEG